MVLDFYKWLFCFHQSKTSESGQRLWPESPDEEKASALQLRRPMSPYSLRVQHAQRRAEEIVLKDKYLVQQEVLVEGKDGRTSMDSGVDSRIISRRKMRLALRSRESQKSDEEFIAGLGTAILREFNIAEKPEDNGNSTIISKQSSKNSRFVKTEDNGSSCERKDTASEQDLDKVSMGVDACAVLPRLSPRQETSTSSFLTQSSPSSPRKAQNTEVEMYSLASQGKSEAALSNRKHAAPGKEVQSTVNLLTQDDNKLQSGCCEVKIEDIHAKEEGSSPSYEGVAYEPLVSPHSKDTEVESQKALYVQPKSSSLDSDMPSATPKSIVEVTEGSLGISRGRSSMDYKKGGFGSGILATLKSIGSAGFGSLRFGKDFWKRTKPVHPESPEASDELCELHESNSCGSFSNAVSMFGSPTAAGFQLADDDQVTSSQEIIRPLPRPWEQRNSTSFACSMDIAEMRVYAITEKRNIAEGMTSPTSESERSQYCREVEAGLDCCKLEDLSSTSKSKVSVSQTDASTLAGCQRQRPMLARHGICILPGEASLSSRSSSCTSPQLLTSKKKHNGRASRFEEVAKEDEGIINTLHRVHTMPTMRCEQGEASSDMIVVSLSTEGASLDRERATRRNDDDSSSQINFTTIHGDPNVSSNSIPTLDLSRMMSFDAEGGATPNNVLLASLGDALSSSSISSGQVPICLASSSPRSGAIILADMTPRSLEKLELDSRLVWMGEDDDNLIAEVRNGSPCVFSTPRYMSPVPEESELAENSSIKQPGARALSQEMRYAGSTTSTSTNSASGEWGGLPPSMWEVDLDSATTIMGGFPSGFRRPKLDEGKNVQLDIGQSAKGEGLPKDRVVSASCSAAKPSCYSRKRSILLDMKSKLARLQDLITSGKMAVSKRSGSESSRRRVELEEAILQDLRVEVACLEGELLNTDSPKTPNMLHSSSVSVTSSRQSLTPKEPQGGTSKKGLAQYPFDDIWYLTPTPRATTLPLSHCEAQRKTREKETCQLHSRCRPTRSLSNEWTVYEGLLVAQETLSSKLAQLNARSGGSAKRRAVSLPSRDIFN